jgi:hypothetical protein
MKGKYHIVIQNNKLHYELDIKRNITIIKGDSATGKTTLIGLIDRISRMGISSGISIADGAAIGPEMNKLYQYMRLHDTTNLYLPESFEWMILKAGVISGINIQSILEHPEEYIDSKKYMSWERYFTNLLIENTKDTFLKYNKGSLNESYLQERIKNSILNIMEGISWYSNYK